MEFIRQHTDCVCMWEPCDNQVFLGSAWQVDIDEFRDRHDNVTIITRNANTPYGKLTSTQKIIDNVQTVWKTEHWCKNIEDVDKAISVPFNPLKYDFSDYARIKNEVNNNGIIMTSLSDPLGMAASLMEFGEFTVWALTETEHFAKIIEILHERVMENLRQMLNRQVVDLYRIYGPEYATPPYLPPQLFERFVVKYVTEMIDLIHSKGGKARLHCHGKINKILEMIAVTGADAIDPCEAPPDGDVELCEIKKRIGNNLCIFGNIQLKLLEQGEKNQIRHIVKESMKTTKAGGGYVIMPTASPINIPLAEKTKENYFTFIESAHEFGLY